MEGGNAVPVRQVYEVIWEVNGGRGTQRTLFPSVVPANRLIDEVQRAALLIGAVFVQEPCWYIREVKADG